jgi:hypothetical protein
VSPVVTFGTLNLEDGEAVELLPAIVEPAGEIGLLCLQEGKAWHLDGQRRRFRAQKLLACCGLSSSVMTTDASRGPLHTLIFWNPDLLTIVSHNDPAWPMATSASRAGVAEFETRDGLVVAARSAHLPADDGDARLAEARRLTWLADPRKASFVGGDMNSLWPDCPGHQELEPRWQLLPAFRRHHKTFPPAADGSLVSDRRAMQALADAGFVSAGCLAGDTKPTVNRKADAGGGGRIDHLAFNETLAACYVPGTYKVHVTDAGNEGSDHRLATAGADLGNCRPSRA